MLGNDTTFAVVECKHGRWSCTSSTDPQPASSGCVCTCEWSWTRSDCAEHFGDAAPVVWRIYIVTGVLIIVLCLAIDLLFLLRFVVVEHLRRWAVKHVVFVLVCLFLLSRLFFLLFEVFRLEWASTFAFNIGTVFLFALYATIIYFFRELQGRHGRLSTKRRRAVLSSLRFSWRAVVVVVCLIVFFIVSMVDAFLVALYFRLVETFYFSLIFRVFVTILLLVSCCGMVWFGFSFLRKLGGREFSIRRLLPERVVFPRTDVEQPLKSAADAIVRRSFVAVILLCSLLFCGFALGVCNLCLDAFAGEDPSWILVVESLARLFEGLGIGVFYYYFRPSRKSVFRADPRQMQSVPGIVRVAASEGRELRELSELESSLDEVDVGPGAGSSDEEDGGGGATSISLSRDGGVFSEPGILEPPLLPSSGRRDRDVIVVAHVPFVASHSGGSECDDVLSSVTSLEFSEGEIEVD